MNGEGELVTGLGIRVERCEALQQTIIIVGDQEMAHNDLAKAWVEALENQANAGRRYLEYRRKRGWR